MLLNRTVLFYAAPPLVLGSLFTVYRLWFSGPETKPADDSLTLPSTTQQPFDPVSPFGGTSGGKTPPSHGKSVPPAPSPGTADAPVTDLESAARVLQELAAGLFGAFPEAAAWAKIPDAISRGVAATDCISLGGSPRQPLSFMAPTTPFRAKQTASGWVIDPASFARYDRIVAVFCAGDAGQVARAYQRLEPALDLAYRKLGYGDRRFREVLARAAGELLAVPVPTAPVAVIPSGQTYAFADPALQGQNDARKHLLRTGPDNIRKVQARIRALAAALKLEIIAP